MGLISLTHGATRTRLRRTELRYQLSFRLHDLQTNQDDKEKSGEFPRRVVKFSLIPGVVVVLKKLPCPDNLKLTPQIITTIFRGVLGELVDIFLFFLHGELTGV